MDHERAVELERKSVRVSITTGGRVVKEPKRVISKPDFSLTLDAVKPVGQLGATTNYNPQVDFVPEYIDQHTLDKVSNAANFREQVYRDIDAAEYYALENE